MLNTVLFELQRGTVTTSAALTLEDFGDQWLARRRVANIDTERGLWRLHVVDSPLATMPLPEIRHRHVRDFVDELQHHRKLIAKSGGKRGERQQSSEPISRQTVRLVFALLRRLFNEAIIEEVVLVNPCTGCRLPVIARAEDCDEPWTYLTVAEIDLLLRCPHDRIPVRNRLTYEVALFTGLREGELWGWRWEDLQLDGQHPEAVVRRSYQGPPKGRKVRHFPLLPAAAAALRQVRAISKDTSPAALVFPSRGGRMYSKGYDGGWESRHRAAAGIDREVRFHDLRHSCASHLVMGSWGRAWSLPEIRDFLGHSSIASTERYAHLARGHLHTLASSTPGPQLLTTPHVVGLEVAAKEDGPRLAHGPSAKKARPEGDRGATRTRDLLFRKHPGELAVSLSRPGDSLPPRTNRGPIIEVAMEVAQAIVTLTASGQWVPEVLIDRLADLVLDDSSKALVEGGQPFLAMEVRRGGAHKLDCALRLADAVLRRYAPIHEADDDDWEGIG